MNNLRIYVTNQVFDIELFRIKNLCNSTIYSYSKSELLVNRCALNICVGLKYFCLTIRNTSSLSFNVSGMSAESVAAATCTRHKHRAVTHERVLYALPKRSQITMECCQSGVCARARAHTTR